jgi:hypothetical protein
MGWIDTIGEIGGSIWEGVSDVADSLGNVLGQPGTGGALVDIGTAIYRHNNPPENRNLPPNPYVGTAAQRRQAAQYYDRQVGGTPSRWEPGYQEGIVEQALEPFFPLLYADDLVRGARGVVGGNGMANGNGGAMVPHAQHSPFSRINRTNIRMMSEVQVQHPETGKVYTYKNMGRPVLYSGDLAASKRVRKVAARARRASGKR